MCKERIYVIYAVFSNYYKQSAGEWTKLKWKILRTILQFSQWLTKN